MAAMAQMAEISNMQAALAEKVQASMQRINSMMNEPPTVPTARVVLDGEEIDEAEAWRRKIALLSTPCSCTINSASTRVETSKHSPLAVSPASSSCASFLLPSAPRASDAEGVQTGMVHTASSLGLPAPSSFETSSSLEKRATVQDSSCCAPTYLETRSAMPLDLDSMRDGEAAPEFRSALREADLDDVVGSSAQSKGLFSRLVCCWGLSAQHQYSRVEVQRAVQQGDSYHSEDIHEKYEEITRL